MPFQFYWFRSVIRFWNDSIKSDNPLFRAILFSDVSLAKRGHACWSKDLLSNLSAINIPPPIKCASRLDIPSSLSPFSVSSDFKSYVDCLNHLWSSLSEKSEDIRSLDALNRRSLGTITYNKNCDFLFNKKTKSTMTCPIGLKLGGWC